MLATDRRLGFREVEVGVQKNGNVLVSSFQGYGESGATILKRKRKQQARLSLSGLHQWEGSKPIKSPKSSHPFCISGSVSGSYRLGRGCGGESLSIRAQGDSVILYPSALAQGCVHEGPWKLKAVH